MAVAAAVIQRKEREIVDTFRGVGATSADRARDPDELSVTQHFAFKRLVDRAVLRTTGDGKFYLDELSWNAFRSLRRRMALVMMFIAIALVIVLGAAGAFVSRS
jgi:hypothetical protein